MKKFVYLKNASAKTATTIPYLPVLFFFAKNHVDKVSTAKTAANFQSAYITKA